MFQYGGVYADLDVECLKNMESLLGADNIVLGTTVGLFILSINIT